MSDAPLPEFRPIVPPPDDAPPPVPPPAGVPPVEGPPAEARPVDEVPEVGKPVRRRWVAVGLIGLTLAAIVAFSILGVRTNAGIEATWVQQDRFVAEAEAAFESIPHLTDDEIALLRRSRNARHVALAESLGAGPPADRDALASLLATGSFVTLDADSLYTVLPGESSVPVLTASGAASLDSIAARFRDKLATKGLPPFRFAVSSVWRTSADQAALRGSNVNAAAGNSSHEYGTTYDITYNPTRYSPAPDALPPPPRVDPRVPGVIRERVRQALIREQRSALDQLAQDYPSRLTALLGRALIELEDEGVVAVVRERLQPVYHVTVARELVP